MSSEFALKIEKATGINAELLLRMDLSYQLNKLKANNREITHVQPFAWASNNNTSCIAEDRPKYATK